MVNIYWKGGTGATKSDPSTQANWVDSAGTAITNTDWNGGDMGRNHIIFDIARNITPTEPVGIIFDGSPSIHTWKTLLIKYNAHAKWHNLISFASSGTTLILSGMDIRQSQVFSATANCIIKFVDVPHFNSMRRAKASSTGSVGGGNDDADLYIKLVDEDSDLNDFIFRSTNYAGTALNQNSYTTAGMFKDTASRGFFTFLFEPPNNTILVLDNGIYPKMDFDCASTYTATLAFDDIYTSYNQYSNSSIIVDMLKLTIDVSFNVRPSDHSLRNKNKHIKLSDGYDLDCSTFDMGYATLEIVPSTATEGSPSYYIPSYDTPLFGPTPSSSQATGMEVKYTNLIIGSPIKETSKLAIVDNNIITCESLRIKAGGRLYGPSYGDSNGAEIHCLATPIVEGDWNFSEVSTGIYRASGTSPTLPVSMGGTGLTSIGTQSQVLAVKSNGQGLEWRADIDTNTIYPSFTGSTTVAGLVPVRDSGGTTTKYLREDGDWIVPPSGGGGAPTNASYVMIGTNPSLSNERVLTAGNGISLTDNGANGTAVIASTITAGLANVVDDDSPQLGDDLDINGHSILSLSNADIAISPNGSGAVVLDGLSWPIADGLENTVLTTDGGAGLTFKSPEKQFILVGEESDDYISSTSTAGNANGYCFSYGNGAQNTTKASGGADLGVHLPIACTLVRVDITFGNIGDRQDTNNQTLTVYKNAASTTSTLVYNSDGTGGQPFTKSFTSLSGNGLSYAAGDRFNLRATGLGGSTQTQVGPARMTAYFTG